MFPPPLWYFQWYSFQTRFKIHLSPFWNSHLSNLKSCHVYKLTIQPNTCFNQTSNYTNHDQQKSRKKLTNPNYEFKQIFSDQPQTTPHENHSRLTTLFPLSSWYFSWYFSQTKIQNSSFSFWNSHLSNLKSCHIYKLAIQLTHALIKPQILQT